MNGKKSTTTRRAFLATSALLLGAGCVERSGAAGDQTPAATPTTTARAPSPTETTPTESTDQKPLTVEDRTTDLDPDVTPLYQGAFIADGDTLDNFENLESWNVRKGGRIRADSTRRFTGTQSLTYEGTGRTIIGGEFQADPLDLREADLSLAARFQQPADRQPTFWVIGEAPDHENQILFKTPYAADKQTGWQRYDLAPCETQGSPDLADIRRLKIAVHPSDDVPVKFNIDDLRAHPKPDRGKLVFRFDDSSAIHYDDYFPVLQNYGYPGIEGIVKETVINDHGLSLQEVVELHEAGWDLCNHTTAHHNIRELSDTELRHDIQEMIDWFDRAGIKQRLDMHIHTYGAYDGASLSILDDYFDVAFAGGGATNYSLTNPLTISSFDAESGIEETKALIDRVATHRSLGVLMFHDQYSRAEFAEIVNYVATNEDQLDVITGRDLNKQLRSR